MGLNEIKEVMKIVEESILCDGANNHNVMLYYCICGYYKYKGGKEELLKRMNNKGIINAIGNYNEQYRFVQNGRYFIDESIKYYKTGMVENGNKLFLTSLLSINNIVNKWNTVDRYLNA
jgi:hypothetical protein